MAKGTKDIKLHFNEYMKNSDLLDILIAKEYAKLYIGCDLVINVNVPHFYRIIKFLDDNEIKYLTSNEYGMPFYFDIQFGSNVQFQNLYIIVTILKLFGLENLYYHHGDSNNILIGSFEENDDENDNYNEYINISVEKFLQIPFYTTTEEFFNEHLNLYEISINSDIIEDYPDCVICNESQYVYKTAQGDWCCSLCEHVIDEFGSCVTEDCEICTIEDSEDLDMPSCEKCGDNLHVSELDDEYWWCSFCNHYINENGECATEDCEACEDDNSEEVECPVCENCGDSNDVVDLGGEYWWCSHCEHDIDGNGVCVTEECITCESVEDEEVNLPVCKKCGESDNVQDLGLEYWWCSNCLHDIDENGDCVTMNCKTCTKTSRFAGLLNKDSKTNYLFFDIETSGLPKDIYAPVTKLDNWPRIVQIAWVLYDSNGKQISKKEHIVKPSDFIITDESTKIHGISQSKAIRYGIEIVKILLDFEVQCSKSKYLIAHNIIFDSKVLGAEFLRSLNRNPLTNLENLCTMLNSVQYCKIPGLNGFKWPKLEELHKKLFGYNFSNAHSAMADVEATAKCFWEMRKLKLI